MGSEGQNGGNSPISSFVMPPMTEVQVSRLFSSLNVQKSSLDVLACVAGGMRERASGGGAANFPRGRSPRVNSRAAKPRVK